MQFTINNLTLLNVLKLMKGFVSKSLTRPILTGVHIKCSNDNDEVITFESTNTTKITRWSVAGKVAVGGDCVVVFSKIFEYLLKQTKKAIPFDVMFFEELGKIKANINGNVVVLERANGTYPNCDGVFEVLPEAYENEPVVDIASLEMALKAMREAGGTTVKFAIPKTDRSKIKITCKPFYEPPIESVIVTLQHWEG